MPGKRKPKSDAVQLAETIAGLKDPDEYSILYSVIAAMKADAAGWKMPRPYQRLLAAARDISKREDGIGSPRPRPEPEGPFDVWPVPKGKATNLRWAVVDIAIKEHVAAFRTKEEAEWLCGQFNQNGMGPTSRRPV